MSRSIVIAGVGESALGRVPGLTTLDLYLQAMERALADAGMAWGDIDGLYSVVSRVDPGATGAPMLAEYIGLDLAFAMSMPVGGMQGTGAIYQAAAIVAAGIAKAILVVSADSLLTGMSSSGAFDHFADTGHPDYEVPFGASIPSLYALAAQRHMHDYGTTREQLAMVAVQARENAGRNADAQARKPITVADVLAAPIIASPFGKLDCSLISDGGCAFVITTEDRARSSRARPIRLLGAGEGRAHQHISQSASLSRFAAAAGASRAYAQAGVSAADIDVALLYDPFTISPILSLEALGFCPVGEGGRYVQDGNIAPGGTIPVNPHGGLLSHCHPGRPGGCLLVVEAVRQLRHEGGERQIADAELAIVQANAGIISGEVTLILGR